MTASSEMRPPAVAHVEPPLEDEWLREENERLRQEVADRCAEVEASARALEATLEIARTVGGETRLDRVLELIADRSLALVQAAGVAILLADGDELVVAAAAGDIPPALISSRVTARGSMAARVLAAGRPVRLGDLAKFQRLILPGLGSRHSSALFVPLLFRGVHIGVIEAFDRLEGPEFRGEDERMLQATAASAAIAVATAQSIEREWLRSSLKAAEEERRRWARELHDETLQGLGGLRVLLSSARRRDDVQSLRDALDTAVSQITDEIANLRLLITELRPAALDELGLKPALETLFERVRQVHGLEIETEVDISESSRLDPDVETGAYRLVQESLTNAARHAHAARVHVHVLELGEEIQIEVRDDGVGFDIEAPEVGYGLTGMRERTSLAGGRLEVASSSSGTTIKAALPSAR